VSKAQLGLVQKVPARTFLTASTTLSFTSAGMTQIAIAGTTANACLPRLNGSFRAGVASVIGRRSDTETCLES